MEQALGGQSHPALETALIGMALAAPGIIRPM